MKTHINHIFTKTSLRDRAQLVRYAYQHGLVPAARLTRPGRRASTRGWTRDLNFRADGGRTAAA